MNAPPSDSRAELKLALVMSGGVSLAIWIGGVSREIYALWLASQPPADNHAGDNRANEAALAPYRQLLELAGTTLGIDVITGASAGGLNGVLLSAAMSRSRPLSDFDDVRNVWLDAADPDTLLRPIGESNPPSLFQGDKVFLPKLRSMLEQMLEPSPQHSAIPHLKLVVTATDLAGESKKTTDNYGADFRYREHATTFTFDRGQFLAEDPGLAAKLAVAGRSSSSFPFAFEPAFVQVGANSDHAGAPDMAEIIDLQSSRYIVDGGVLNNKPVDLALDAIGSRPAVGADRRLVMFVEPDPHRPQHDGAAEKRERPTRPSLGEVVLDSAINIPRKLDVGPALTRIEGDNDFVRKRRASRNWVASNIITVPLAESHDDDEDSSFESIAKAYERFHDVRTEATLRSLRRRLDRRRPADTSASDQGVRDRVVADVAKSLSEKEHFLPKRLRIGDDFLGDESTPRQWKLGLAPLGYLSNLTNDYLRLLLHQPKPPDALPIWLARHRLMTELVVTIDELGDAYWGVILAEPEPSDFHTEAGMRNWLETSFELWPILPCSTRDPDNPGLPRYRAALVDVLGLAAQAEFSKRDQPTSDNVTYRWIRQQMTEVARALAELLADLHGAFREQDLRDVRDAIERLHPENASPADVINRVLWLYVVELGLTGESSPRVLGAPIEWMLVTSETPSPMAGKRTPSEKVAGIKLGHFGAFLKRSWRANDWMWGRLDGIANLSRSLFTPKRLEHLLAASGKVDEQAAAFHDQLLEFTGMPPSDVPGLEAARAVLDKSSFVAAAKDAIEKADTKGVRNGNPDQLKALAEGVAELVTWRMQCRVVAEELAYVSEAIEADDAMKLDKTSSAKAFQRKMNKIKGPLGDQSDADIKSLADACRVGAEGMNEIAITPAFAETAARTVNLMTAAGASADSGLGPVKRLLQLAVVPTAVAGGLASIARRRTPVTTGIVVAALTAAVAVLAGSFLGATVPSWLFGVAAVAVGLFVVLAGLAHGHKIVLALLGIGLLFGGASLGRALLAPQASALYSADGNPPIVVELDETWADLGARISCVGPDEMCRQEDDRTVVALTAATAWQVYAPYVDWSDGVGFTCSNGVVEAQRLSGGTAGAVVDTPCEVLTDGTAQWRAELGKVRYWLPAALAVVLITFWLAAPASRRRAAAGGSTSKPRRMPDSPSDAAAWARAAGLAIVVGVVTGLGLATVVGPGLRSTDRADVLTALHWLGSNRYSILTAAAMITAVVLAVIGVIRLVTVAAADLDLRLRPSRMPPSADAEPGRDPHVI